MPRRSPREGRLEPRLDTRLGARPFHPAAVDLPVVTEVMDVLECGALGEREGAQADVGVTVIGELATWVSGAHPGVRRPRAAPEGAAS